MSLNISLPNVTKRFLEWTQMFQNVTKSYTFLQSTWFLRLLKPSSLKSREIRHKNILLQRKGYVKRYFYNSEKKKMLSFPFFLPFSFMPHRRRDEIFLIFNLNMAGIFKDSSIDLLEAVTFLKSIFNPKEEVCLINRDVEWLNITEEPSH